MIPVVVEQVFAVAIVILHKEELVFPLENAIVKLHNGVAIQVPARSLHHSDSSAKASVWRHVLDTRLIDT